MTGKDIEDVEAKFAERCDRAIAELYAARDELFETMGRVSPAFSYEWRAFMDRSLEGVKSWKEVMCKNVERAVFPSDEK